MSLGLTLKLGVLSLTNVGLMFLFQIGVLAYFGATLESDAFFASMTVPQLVQAIITGSLVSVLVPLLSGEAEQKSRKDAWTFFWAIGALFFSVAVVLGIFASWWVPWSVPGFEPGGWALAVELTRIQLVGVVFAGLNAVQWASFHSRHEFLRAELSQLAANIGAVIILVVSVPRFGVLAAAWANLARMAIQTVLLLPGMGWPSPPNRASETLIEAWKRIRPLLAGNAYYKTEPLVDRALLSIAASGNLSLYYFAHQIYGAATHVINRAVASPLVPRLSILYKTGDVRSVSRLVYQRMVFVAIFCGVVLTTLVWWGDELLPWLVGYGKFGDANIAKLWWILILLGGVLVGGVLGMLASTAFYSMGDTTTPTTMSMITYSVYIPIKILSFVEYGVTGLAIATSIYYLSNLALHFVLLNRRWSNANTT